MVTLQLGILQNQRHEQKVLPLFALASSGLYSLALTLVDPVL
jgi:hypothetical protein